VPFHVEVSAGINHARVFNLNREDLMAKVVGPWLEDRTIAMGEREWAPRDSDLKILEGPEMAGPDLAFGQGWANAERSSENATRRLLSEAPPPHLPDAFVVETDSPEAVAADLVAGHDGRAIQWSEARGRIDGRDPEIAAVILVVRKPEPERQRSPGPPREP
jgi:hypothetical protein